MQPCHPAATHASEQVLTAARTSDRACIVRPWQALRPPMPLTGLYTFETWKDMHGTDAVHCSHYFLEVQAVSGWERAVWLQMASTYVTYGRTRSIFGLDAGVVASTGEGVSPARHQVESWTSREGEACRILR